jgi:hypothetical protein
MRKVLLVLLLIVLVYAGAGAYTELRLINLVRSPEPKQAEPTTYIDDQGVEHSFNNRRVMEIFQKEGQRDRFFPWTRDLDEWVVLGVLAAACGYAGGFLRLFMEAQTGAALHRNNPFIGAFLGVAITIVVAGGDALMMEGDFHFRPGAVAGVCLLSGIAWEYAWAFLKKKGKDRF